MCPDNLLSQNAIINFCNSWYVLVGRCPSLRGWRLIFQNSHRRSVFVTRVVHLMRYSWHCCFWFQTSDSRVEWLSSQPPVARRLRGEHHEKHESHDLRQRHRRELHFVAQTFFISSILNFETHFRAMSSRSSRILVVPTTWQHSGYRTAKWSPSTRKWRPTVFRVACARCCSAQASARCDPTFSSWASRTTGFQHLQRKWTNTSTSSSA